MKKTDHFLRSFINAAGVFLYILGVAWLGFNNQAIFEGPDSFLMPVFMLLLFILSASVTGFLVLGKPILLYLDGAKKEAFTLLFTTLAWLLVFLFVVALVLISR